MATIEVQVEKNPVQVTDDIQNYQVVEADGWDLGAPIGNGATLEHALQDFESSYELKHDEEIKALVVKTNW